MFLFITRIVCPGYQDFVPEHNQRNKENKGYEVLSDVMERANRWVARQQGVRFTNLQTISIKLKKSRTSRTLLCRNINVSSKLAFIVMIMII